MTTLKADVTEERVREMLAHAVRNRAQYIVGSFVWDSINDDVRILTELLSLRERVRGDEWQPIATARKTVDETVLLRIEHMNYGIAASDDKHRWEELVTAYWTDFNGGGWVWHGLAGTPTHWRPLPRGFSAIHPAPSPSLGEARLAEGEPVAWRVKDFADGWMLFHTEEYARREAAGAGNLVQPLYAHVQAEAGEAKPRLTLNGFAGDLAAALASRAVTLRDLETEIGISKSAISRATRGKSVSAENFVALWNWLHGSAPALNKGL